MRHFFGFGSLVNRSSHPFDVSGTALIRDHQRAWVSVDDGEFAFLSMAPEAGFSVYGLVLDVAPDAQGDLDAREVNYSAHVLNKDLLEPDFDAANKLIEAYRADEPPATHTDEKPILRSYLDCVFQGYIKVFGSGAPQAFVSSTKGWHRPILDDRADPIYPRHVKLTKAESQIIEDVINSI